MTETSEHEAFRFIPGPFQYSAGVAAKSGFALHRFRFVDPVRLADGFKRIEALMASDGLPFTAFCACELRSPAPFTDAGFAAFNREYVGTLERWGLFSNDVNPVARSNVCPELHKPDGPSFHAFTLAVPALGAPPSFVVAGGGEAPEGGESYREHTVRHGDTSTEGMAEKIAYVMTAMERRMGALGATWADTTATQVYTVFDIFPHLAQGIVARGGARHGADWHYCRPPVIGLDYEMDCRAVHVERVLA